MILKALDRVDEEQFKLLVWNHRVRLVIDYISGMTDDFALHEYQTLLAL